MTGLSFVYNPKEVKLKLTIPREQGYMRTKLNDTVTFRTLSVICFVSGILLD